MQASCASLLLASMSSNMSPCISLHNGAEPLRRGASPLRPAEFPVYAYNTSFGLLLFHSANTRYEWMANPYTAGTCTPQEAPSFAWRTEDEDERAESGARLPLALSHSTKRRDIVWRRSVADKVWRQGVETRCKCEAPTLNPLLNSLLNDTLHPPAYSILVHSRLPFRAFRAFRG